MIPSPTEKCRSQSAGNDYVPVYHEPHKRIDAARVSAEQVRLDDARMHAEGRYALAAKTVVQGARMDDVGLFGVAVSFPGY